MRGNGGWGGGGGMGWGVWEVRWVGGWGRATRQVMVISPLLADVPAQPSCIRAWDAQAEGRLPACACAVAECEPLPAAEPSGAVSAAHSAPALHAPPPCPPCRAPSRSCRPSWLPRVSPLPSGSLSTRQSTGKSRGLMPSSSTRVRMRVEHVAASRTERAAAG